MTGCDVVESTSGVLLLLEEDSVGTDVSPTPPAPPHHDTEEANAHASAFKRRIL